MCIARIMDRGRESLAPVGAVAEEQIGPTLFRWVVVAHVATAMGMAAKLAPVCKWEEDIPWEDYC